MSQHSESQPQSMKNSPRPPLTITPKNVTQVPKKKKHGNSKEVRDALRVSGHTGGNVSPNRKPKKKRKIIRVERQLPSKVEAVDVNSIPYKRLCVLERRLDAMIMRKRFELQDHLRRPHRATKTLRIFVSAKAEEDAWTLRVEGKVLDDIAIKERRRKFSSFFSKIVIELNKDEYKDKHLVEWHRPADLADLDGIEVKRKGTINTTKNKLQDKTRIINDIYLQQIFGRIEMDFTSLAAELRPFLLPLDVIALEYEIRPGDGEGKDLVVDIEVQGGDNIQRTEAHNFLLNTVDGELNQINQFDHQIKTKIAKLQEAMKKRNFMKRFAADPVAFSQSWVESQYRDYKTAHNLRGNAEEERSAVFYHKPWAEEATWKYLTEKSVGKREQLEEQVQMLKNN
ncbi:hypothetical protein, variant 1 [Sphaeroforma arctica JP610]|uniref:Uncharacterized protein n=1 Tax=Sphaeroforma arctica JP610 TaxID=667725 RepID=A0A0L0FYJ5_9EUKA|nr:hypothetical protein, variant 1 [Sphaeroforma arctica JP610]KNC81694.1 hypothetical protein, variant 1 [Sphaeroforma arctica JP610]|eukprot:XP_014155596.1 hypothetical protein, variant 1 [Sphaeroforma arctica JP610]